MNCNYNCGFQDLRYEALKLSMEKGVCLSHRLKEIRFDEPGAMLLPDMKTEPHSGFSVGDVVNVMREFLLPWHHLLPYEVDRCGVNTAPYQHNAFQILCFAHVTAKKGHCQLMGTFCLLADWGKPYPLFDQPGLLWSNGKMLLHWSGALKRPKEPIRFPR